MKPFFVLIHMKMLQYSTAYFSASESISVPLVIKRLASFKGLITNL